MNISIERGYLNDLMFSILIKDQYAFARMADSKIDTINLRIPKRTKGGFKDGASWDLPIL